MIPLFRIGAGIKLVILIAMLVPACPLTCISSWSPLILCVVTPLAEDSFFHSVFCHPSFWFLLCIGTLHVVLIVLRVLPSFAEKFSHSRKLTLKALSSVLEAIQRKSTENPFLKTPDSGSWWCEQLTSVPGSVQSGGWAGTIHSGMV